MSQFLLHYRATPSNALGGLTPAEVHIGRRLRTRTSLMMPRKDHSEDSTASTLAMKDQFDKHNRAKARYFHEDEKVFAKVYERNSWSWKPGKVANKQGKVVYVNILDDGRERAVHANQLKPRVDEKETVRVNAWKDTMSDTSELLPYDNEDYEVIERKTKLPTIMPTLKEDNSGSSSSTTPAQPVQSPVVQGPVQGDHAQQQDALVLLPNARGPSRATSPVPIRRSTRQHSIRFDPCA